MSQSSCRMMLSTAVADWAIAWSRVSFEYRMESGLKLTATFVLSGPGTGLSTPGATTKAGSAVATTLF